MSKSAKSPKVKRGGREERTWQVQDSVQGAREKRHEVRDASIHVSKVAGELTSRSKIWVVEVGEEKSRAENFFAKCFW